MEPELEALLAFVLLMAAFFLRKERGARFGWLNLQQLWAVPPVWARVFFWIGLAVLAHAAARAAQV